MPWGAKRTTRGPKHHDLLRSEFEATRQSYVTALDTHAADAAERHAHVNDRLATLEREEASLQALRDEIAAA